MDDADVEDSSPVNPFRYWKERIRDENNSGEESKAEQLGSQPRRGSAECSRGSGSRVPHQPSTIHPRKEQEAPRTGATSTKGSPPPNVSKKITPPPRPAGPSFNSREQDGTAPQAQQKIAPPAHQHAGLGPSESLQERIGKFEATMVNNSDAESYVPKMKKIQGPPVHKHVTKSNSNPIIPERPSLVLRPRPSLKSTGSLEQASPPKSRNFIPTIQTIHASTGEDLSMDETELFRPTKGKVLDVAKKMDESLLIPHSRSPVRGRRGSSGDINNRVSLLG